MLLVLHKFSNDPKAQSHDFLSKCLFEFCDIKNAEELIKKTEHGKPLIDGCAFSISHSKKALCIALSCEKQPVLDINALVIDEVTFADSLGVDIESVFDKEYDRCKKIADAKFFDNEKTLLSLCKTQSEFIDLFCDIWTKKESYCKYTGVGLKDAMSFDTTDYSEDLIFYTKNLLIDDKKFSLSVCYNAK
ncbi:MAG: 4'-phosphopantetheinyl transferase superfamily protein [Ruminococcaceae bacterium]|nr:4'-phosphopantetheinyl transferase superfamily protein [Oscillospiraceae bacterium]